MRINKKVNFTKAVAIFLMILAMVIYYYEEIKKPAEKEITLHEVVTVKEDIDENTVITENMLIIQKYSSDDVKQNNIAASINDVLGKRTLTPLYKGEMISTYRLIDNEPHMNKLDQTQIAIAIKDSDKALEYKKGDFIDIWIEPISNTSSEQQPTLDDNGVIVQTVAESKKIIETIRITELHDTNFNIVNKQLDALNEQTSSTELYVPAYITIELPDEMIKALYEIDKTKYNIRVTRYGDEKKYDAMVKTLERNSQEEQNE